MPTLTIRNIDKDVHQSLREKAAASGQSMEAMVRGILKQEVKPELERSGDALRRFHARFAEIGGVDELKLPEQTPIADPINLSE